MAVTKPKARHKDVEGRLRRNRVLLEASPYGGFQIGTGMNELGGPNIIASFSTLDETLAWLHINMAQPATEPERPA